MSDLELLRTALEKIRCSYIESIDQTVFEVPDITNAAVAIVVGLTAFTFSSQGSFLGTFNWETYSWTQYKP